PGTRLCGTSSAFLAWRHSSFFGRFRCVVTAPRKRITQRRTRNLESLRDCAQRFLLLLKRSRALERRRVDAPRPPPAPAGGFDAHARRFESITDCASLHLRGPGHDSEHYFSSGPGDVEAISNRHELGAGAPELFHYRESVANA